jgi:glycerol-3-phosphate O-acyltransferase
LEEAARHLVRHGVLAREGDRLSIAQWPAARTMVATVQNFFEAYFVVLRASSVLRERPLTEKELVEAAMKVGRRMYLIEDVRHPEAISKINLTNAVRHFRSKGVLTAYEDRDGRDARLMLDEEARERYMGPMRKLFHSDRLQPKPVGAL